MDAFERQLLQDTHDTAMRSVQQNEQILERLKSSENKFANHEARISIIERQCDDCTKESKARRWWMRMALAALAVPAAEWLWNLFFAKGKP